MRHSRMQPPDNVHRKSQDGDICENIRDCVPDRRDLELDANARQSRVLGLFDRSTLEHAHADNFDDPSDDDTARDDCGYANASRWEDASIHEQDGRAACAFERN